MSILDDDIFKNDQADRQKKQVKRHYTYWILIVIFFIIQHLSYVPFSKFIHPATLGGFLGYLLFSVFYLRIRESRFLGMLIVCIIFTVYSVITYYLEMNNLFDYFSILFYAGGFALTYIIYRSRYRI